MLPFKIAKVQYMSLAPTYFLKQSVIFSVLSDLRNEITARDRAGKIVRKAIVQKMCQK